MSESAAHPATTPAMQFVTSRIDQPHAMEREPVPVRKLQPRRTSLRTATVVAAAGEVAATTETLPPQVAKHMDDIAWQLSERLREVEQRELEFADYSTRLQMAEANAQSWVMEQEQQLLEREQSLQLEVADLQTRVVANAAMEIAAQDEQAQLRATWETQLREISQRETAVTLNETRLQEQQHALTTATERFHAEQRRTQEQLRAQRQHWEQLREQDRQQAERALVNLQKHRAALEQREQQLRSREAILEHLQDQQVQWERVRLELEREKAEVVRERRLATEQRWIAGNLWAKLTAANFVVEGELYAALRQVSRELETLYRRERESLEKLRIALIEMARKIAPTMATTEPTTGSVKPRMVPNVRPINRAAVLAEAS